MAFVEINVQGWEETDVQLRRVLDALSVESLTGLVAGPINEWQTKKIEERFAGEHDPTGQGWQPLSWPTQEYREKSGWGREHPILVNTGDFKSWMTSGGDARVSGLGAEIRWPGPGGSEDDMRKYRTHQFGTKSNQYGFAVPARPVLGFVPQDLAEAVAVTLEWFEFQTGLINA